MMRDEIAATFAEILASHPLGQSWAEGQRRRIEFECELLRLSRRGASLSLLREVRNSGDMEIARQLEALSDEGLASVCRLFASMERTP